MCVGQVCRVSVMFGVRSIKETLGVVRCKGYESCITVEPVLPPRPSRAARHSIENHPPTLVSPI